MPTSSGARVTVGDMKGLEKNDIGGPAKHVSRCRECLYVTSGIGIGFVRMLICIPVLFLFIAHAHSPPVGDRSSRANITDDGIRTISAVWGYTRFSLECAASFILFGDAIVTFLSFTGHSAGRYSFLSLFEIPHWVLRFGLASVVCSALSCDTYDYISVMWSDRLAKVYTAVPVATLVSSVLTLFLWKVPIVSDLGWLSFPVWRTNVKGWMWNPNMNVKKVGMKRGAAETRVLIQRGFLLAWPLFSIGLNLLGLVFVVTDKTYTCSIWRSSFNYALHILLNILVIAYILFLVVTKTKQPIFHLVKWLLVYLLSAVLADVQYHVTNLVGFCIIQALGFILIIALPFMVILLPFDCKEYSRQRLAWIVEFFKNFKSFNKWLRLVTVSCHVLALTGAVLAILALPLDWFNISFEADGVLEDIIKTKLDFEAKLDEAIKELQKVIDFGDTFSVFDNCPAFISAVVAAIGLSLIPLAGPAASRAALTTLRTAKFFKRVARKAVSYRRQFRQMRDLSRNLTQVANDVKKPLVVAATVDNYGLVVFLMPVLMTGVIALFFAFWPRKVSAKTDKGKKKKKAIIFAVALMLAVFNAFGLFLFEIWGPLIAEIASAIPLMKASLVKGPGWYFVENGFICSLLASVIFPINSVIVLVKEKINPACSKRGTDPINEGGPYMSENMPMETIMPQATSSVFDQRMDPGKQKNLPIENKKNGRRKHYELKHTNNIEKQNKEITEAGGIRKGRVASLLPSYSGSIPPRGWALSIFIMSVSLGLSLASISMDWISYDPTLKPKWAKLVNRFIENGRGTQTLQKDLEDDANDCDLFPNNLDSLMPTLLSPDFRNQWNSILLKLQIPEFDLIDLNLNYRISTPNIFAITFAVPCIACWILVLAGFISSFFKPASFFYSGQEVREWISKIALFVVFEVLNSIITMIKLMQGFYLPLFSLNIAIGNGLVVWFIAQVLILIVWLLLQIESIAPPHFDRPDDDNNTENEAVDWVTYNVERTKKTVYMEKKSHDIVHQQL